MAKQVTLKDIAQEAGVSVALVSFVMNNRMGADGKQKYRVGESTRQRILEVARRLHYRPVERILRRSVRALVVGVILPDPADGWTGAFSARLEQAAYPEGCTLLFGYTQGDPVRFKRLSALLLERKVDGLVALPPADEGDPLEEIRRSGVPCVVPDSGEEPGSSATECASRLFRLLQEYENNVINTISL